ncbi:M14 family metallopeptidase [Parapedobacter koreensis]|uniref:Zinc carboxypeptidase n=1 Tax=Parapedobacter koreensis TaxID=332977 RepID=A0A1H7Q3B4_9SPHI|nr:M14 family metallopeptidase [Parapedobacter koreensis]SEL42580.1 Zinc carboxypeptidase [Parapedobacter koreensis]
MKKQLPRPLSRVFLIALGLYCLCMTTVVAQTQSPREFLGYEIGARFTPHHRVVAYFEHVAATNKDVKLVSYGTSNEWRPLIAAFVSSSANMANLETIRKDNLKRAGLESGEATTRVPITWLSYNVHGNEAVSCETAMKTLWELVNPANTETKKWLENTVVVIDPCLNPDGQERYVNWYNQKVNRRLQPDPQSLEHAEPWPGGRPNHYLFDLNRDWAWQVQRETQARISLYNQWMPQVHVDFHEQGINAPYYFAPAAEPVHAFVSDFQRSFQETVGRNNARYFDENAWLYFTREVFDLFYPSYGDSWPMFNGAIGMTYEQGGSGRAGLGVLTALGDTLTLAERISHHYTSGMATIETVSNNAGKLIDEYANYFNESRSNPKGQYKAYVIKAGNSPERLLALKKLLDRNGIQYGEASSRSGLKGFDYFSGKTASFALESGDVVVSAYQPKSVLAQTLFEPNPALSDSVTYDITSWALPYAYGLQAYALETRLDVTAATPIAAFEPNHPTGKPLAYIAPWTSVAHARFAAALLNAGIRIRYADHAFTLGGKNFPSGSLIIPRTGNEKRSDFADKVIQLANDHQIHIEGVTTGYVDTGKDFGSGAVRPIQAPKVALIAGDGTSSLSVGEVWHFFEQELDYPLSILEPQQLSSADLSAYNTIILPSGNYGAWGDAATKKLEAWIRAGGKVIAIEGAVGFFSGRDGFGLSAYLNEDERKAAEKKREQEAAEERIADFQARERAEIAHSVSGAVFEVKVDATYPLGFGTEGKYYTLKNNGRRYAYLKEGINVGIIPDLNYYRTGFVGAKVKEAVGESLVFGVEHVGRGQVIYLVDNPLFRGFWENGKLIFSNALFMVGQ